MPHQILVPLRYDNSTRKIMVMTLFIGISPQKTSKYVVPLKDGKIFFSLKKKKKVSRGIRRMGFGLIVLGVHIFWNYEQRFIQKKKMQKEKRKNYEEI
jgi:hypothetical protein